MTFRYRPRSTAPFAALPLLLLALLPLPAVAETRVGGDIKGVVEWTKAGSPYIVTADITIPEGSTLRIGPGVVVRFKPNLADQKGVRPFDLEIAVYGTLECTGADGDSVLLTSDAINPENADWAGIVVASATGLAKLDRTIVECGTSAITVVDGTLDMTRSMVRACSEKGIHFMRGKGRITRSYVTIVGNYAGTGKGIYLVQSPDVLIEDTFVIGAQSGIVCERGSDVTIRRSLASLCRLYGITITSSSPDIRQTNVTQNEFGIMIRGNSQPKIRDCNIFDNAVWEIQVKDYRGSGPRAPIDLSGNWWGRITQDIVYEKIEDGDDDPAAGGVVSIEPVRPEAYQPQ
jgi:hypothetical protein